MLIVDDSVTYREFIARAVEDTGQAVVKHAASNGKLALERLSQNTYDVVLMDVVMPEMDGITALDKINNDYPGTPVVMLSGIDYKSNAEITVKALRKGAIDFIIKPGSKDRTQNIKLLKNHLNSLFTGIRLKKASGGFAKSAKEDAKSKEEDDVLIKPAVKTTARLARADFVLIASSTGGPVALENVITGISANFRQTILVVQHMPAGFTKVLAESLNKKASLEVIEGHNGLVSKDKQVIIAPGGLHTIVKRTGGNRFSIQTIDTEPVNGVKPSADVTFKSFANEFRSMEILTVILTGMGGDGKEGVRELKNKCRCYCITESERTAVIYGMPKVVYKAGLSDEELELGSIAKRVEHISRHGS